MHLNMSTCASVCSPPAAAVLIGCLPTYSQAGLAAPIMLSLLRLVQGIAVGGELGTAVVFMHELAPAGSKTKGGSIIFIGVSGLTLTQKSSKMATCADRTAFVEPYYL